eukprot:TRINITY_DN7554_c0_g1_i4.p3 TRINITY_DN7554_c0_g1~~TRINITY_DN7554_c0_g1_i4.p3  ORF type:complete len:159 (+),score=26.27 TRINITY_DN7554_c0_g1_i4:37-513(+)
MEGASAHVSPSWAAVAAREEGHRGAAAHQLSAMRQRSEGTIVRLAKMPSEQLDEARRQGHATMVGLADAIRQPTPYHSRQEPSQLATPSSRASRAHALPHGVDIRQKQWKRADPKALPRMPRSSLSQCKTLGDKLRLRKEMAKGRIGGRAAVERLRKG